MSPHGPPVGLDVISRRAQNEGGIPFIDDGAHRFTGFGPHGDAFTPADNSVRGFHADQYRSADGAEVVRVRIGDGDGFNGGNLDDYALQRTTVLTDNWITYLIGLTNY